MKLKFSVAATCLLPRRAKDLSAPLYSLHELKDRRKDFGFMDATF